MYIENATLYLSAWLLPPLHFITTHLLVLYYLTYILLCTAPLSYGWGA